MPSPSRLARLLLDRRLPGRTRLGLVVAVERRRLLPKAAYAVRYGAGSIYLSHDDFAIDRKSFEFVASNEAYAGDYAGAVVLDLGAHKGYYGAYALAHGARAVVSYEPEEANLDLLERGAASFRARGADWRVRPVAVGAERGEAPLHVMAGSWGHALNPPDSFARYEVGTQRVPVAALAEVLQEAEALAGAGSRLVVKLNIEGEECGTVLGTSAVAWEGADEVFIETHPWAACGAPELAEHLAGAGLIPVVSSEAVVLQLRRGAPRSGTRTAPT
jgi:FkbM family methyltransferase